MALAAQAPVNEAPRLYLNRLSDLCWTLARWVEADEGFLPSRNEAAPR